MLSRRLKILLLLLVGNTPLVHGETVHIGHCLAGCPTGNSPANELLVRNLYAASINNQTRTADWVAYRVLKNTIGVASLLPRIWQDDELSRAGLTTNELDGRGTRILQPNLENQQDRDYRLTEIIVDVGDRGRLVPMTSFAGTSYWSDLNRLTVMSLMKPEMRIGPWSRLDQAINKLADQYGEVFVVVGPVYGTTGSMAASEVANSNQPIAFFKLVATERGTMAAFQFDQELPQHAGFCQQSTSLAAIESASSLTLFPQLTGKPDESLAIELGC